MPAPLPQGTVDTWRSRWYLSASPGTGHSSGLVLRKRLLNGTEMRLTLCTRRQVAVGASSPPMQLLSATPLEAECFIPGWEWGHQIRLFKKKKLYVSGCMKSLLWRQLLWRVGAFVVMHGLCSTEREILVPRPGTGPLSPALQGGV